jgi:hypothetical protein
MYINIYIYIYIYTYIYIYIYINTYIYTNIGSPLFDGSKLRFECKRYSRAVGLTFCSSLWYLYISLYIYILFGCVYMYFKCMLTCIYTICTCDLNLMIYERSVFHFAATYGDLIYIDIYKYIYMYTYIYVYIYT